eukprot:5426560-Pyramimonas_sp.AAC.1
MVVKQEMYLHKLLSPVLHSVHLALRQQPKLGNCDAMHSESYEGSSYFSSNTHNRAIGTLSVSEINRMQITRCNMGCVRSTSMWVERAPNQLVTSQPQPANPSALAHWPRCSLILF